MANLKPEATSVGGLGKPRVSLLTFSESREDFYERRRSLVEAEHARLVEGLAPAFEVLTVEPIRKKSELKTAVADFGAVDAVVAHIPIFVEPALIASLASLTYGLVPIVLVGNQRLDSSSLVGLLGAGGALDQMGVDHLRVWADAEDDLSGAISAYVRAGRCRRMLRGQTFGLFGGPSLGILTAASDPLQWQIDFGIEVKQIDQYRIVVEADRLPDELVDRHRDWYLGTVGGAKDDDSFRTDWLDRQIRSYLATRKLVEEFDLDFISVKCQSELSDYYALQCVSHSLLNDPYDADGYKEPLAASCEGDMDQALTMQLLKLLSGGSPAAALDVRFYETDSGRFRMANCGSSPSFFASASGRPEESLREVHLEPHVFGKAGGYATQFVFAAGPVTLARLARKEGRYWLALLTGTFEAEERDRLHETTWPWPHAFIQTDICFDDFLQKFGSNHICAVRGDVVAELTAWARLNNIEVCNFDPKRGPINEIGEGL